MAVRPLAVVDHRLVEEVPLVVVDPPLEEVVVPLAEAEVAIHQGQVDQ